MTIPEIMICNTSEIKNNNSACVILAGGHSSRMGYPKMWLPYDNELTFLASIVKQYQQLGCERIVVVINQEFCNDWLHFIRPLEPKVDFVVNHFPDKGRLYSLQLGLELVQDAYYVFVQNVDNPFVEEELLRTLAFPAPSRGYVSPVYNCKGGHPIVLSSECVARLLKSAWNQTLKEALESHKKYTKMVLDERIHWNINTPEDYQLKIGKSIPSLRML